MRDLSRRDVLASATALGAVALAGCVAENDDGDNGSDDPDNTSDPDNTDDPDNTSDPDNGDDTGTESEPETELELLETGLTTASADCGSGDMVEASIADGDLVLAGKVPASNPCNEAVLDESTFESGALSVAVGVEDTTGEGEGCMSCLGVVDYEATLSFSADLTDLSAFESVTVEHGGASGETHTIEETGVVSGQVSRSEDRSDRDTPENTVLADSIVTTDRGCTGNVPPSDDPERVEAGDETEFTQTGDTVTVEGSLTASTPCHEAYVESVSYDGGELSLVVGAESNLDPDEFCVECLAEIQYEATVELAESVSVDGVSVTHIEAGG